MINTGTDDTITAETRDAVISVEYGGGQRRRRERTRRELTGDPLARASGGSIARVVPDNKLVREKYGRMEEDMRRRGK